MPKQQQSALGRRDTRRVGVEIEFGGIDASDTARIVRETLGGSVELPTPYTAVVRGTSIGDVEVELDWAWVHKASDAAEKEPSVIDKTKELVVELGKDVVPTEIVAPPLAGERIGELDTLVKALIAGGAKGTRASLVNGFGVHLNPELWEEDLNVRCLRRVLQAYLLMSPTLRRAINVDLTRTVLPFVGAFGEDYLDHVLRPDYDPDLRTLISDYIDFNPTRNRELDMLPMFAHLDEDLVRARLSDTKISRRPTFHWRLPNTDLENPDWSISQEWERWISVEALALDEERLAQRIAAWATDRSRPWLERI